jgi:hypothetical protein
VSSLFIKNKKKKIASADSFFFLLCSLNFKRKARIIVAIILSSVLSRKGLSSEGHS